MAKTFRLNLDFGIETQYEGLIPVVALVKGWTPTVPNPANALPIEIEVNGVMVPNPDYSAQPVIANPVTPIDYIADFLKPQQKQLIGNLIRESLYNHFGNSQAALIESAMQGFDLGFNCTITFEDVVNP